MQSQSEMLAMISVKVLNILNYIENWHCNIVWDGWEYLKYEFLTMLFISPQSLNIAF